LARVRAASAAIRRGLESGDEAQAPSARTKAAIPLAVLSVVFMGLAFLRDDFAPQRGDAGFDF
jgi:hypothetical protein